MKVLLVIFTLLFVLKSGAFAAQVCEYGKTNQCPESKTCVRVDKAKSECIKIDELLPLVEYPFPEQRGILCDQGVESKIPNSHSFLKTIYALDLKTPDGTDADGIKAGVSGIAYVYNECIENNTSCGDGWGNHVRILTDNKIVVQYAHFEKIWIKTGDRVKAGTYIGLEGSTGFAGKPGVDNRHLHLSAHFRDRYYSEEDFFNGYLPKSIPFKMNMCQWNHGTCNGQAVDVRQIKCKRETDKLEWVNYFKLNQL